MVPSRVPSGSGARRRPPSRRSRWPRRFELLLGILGLSLLAVVAVSKGRSALYQSGQGRVFLEMQRAAAEAARPRLKEVSVEARPTSEPSAPSRPAPATLDPAVLGRIEIPRVGVSAIVVEGDDDATLARAVGHIPGTARPGEPGNVALAGHRDSFFRGLRHLRIRDAIELRTPGGRELYQVESMTVVGPNDVGVLAPAGAPVLTLVTCYPFSWIGPAPKRFVVRASKVADPNGISRLPAGPSQIAPVAPVVPEHRSL